MPESPQQHRHRQIAVRPSITAPVPAQGDIKIVPQPGGKTDVPPLPEIAGVGRKVRQPEIQPQFDAQHS